MKIVRSSLFGQPLLTSVNGGLGAVTQAEATQDVGYVVLYRTLADHQSVCYFTVVRALRDEAQHFYFPAGQTQQFTRIGYWRRRFALDRLLHGGLASQGGHDPTCHSGV